MALQITVNISDFEQKVLEHYLLNINEWVQDAVKHKILQCAKKAIDAYSPLNVRKMAPLEIKRELERLTLVKRTGDEVN